MKSTTFKYGWLAQTFHWLSALLILVMIPIGITMTRIEDGSVKTMLYQAHVGIGLTVLTLTLLRIIWRFVEPAPQVPPGLSPLRRLVRKSINIGQYIVLLALFSSGIASLLASGLSPFPGSVLPAAVDPNLIPVIGHVWLSRIFIALLVAHLAGVIEYQLFTGNGLARMGLALGRKTQDATE